MLEDSREVTRVRDLAWQRKEKRRYATLLEDAMITKLEIRQGSTNRLRRMRERERERQRWTRRVREVKERTTDRNECRDTEVEAGTSVAGAARIRARGDACHVRRLRSQRGRGWNRAARASSIDKYVGKSLAKLSNGPRDPMLFPLLSRWDDEETPRVHLVATRPTRRVCTPTHVHG